VGCVAWGGDGADGFDQQAAATKTSVGRATSKRIRAIGIVLKSILEGNGTSEGLGDRRQQCVLKWFGFERLSPFT
jgi:hypothetical protein